MSKNELKFTETHIELFNHIRKEFVNIIHNNTIIDSNFKGLKGVIDINVIYKIMNDSYVPPCIKNMYESMRSKGHLKHMGRFTFGSFLKVLGVPYDITNLFIRTEFSRSGITSGMFDKNYD